MMEYIPDNYDLYEEEVWEQERTQRLYKRLAAEEAAESREEKNEYDFI